MKSIIVILFVFFFNILSSAMTWEIGLRVENTDGDGIEKHVRLYKKISSSGNTLYFELFRNGNTIEDLVSDNPNGVFDVIYCTGIPNTNNPIWPAIGPGTYYLVIDNNYCSFTFIDPECHISYGAPDIIIKYRNGLFSLNEPTWAVDSIDGTFDWDVVSADFAQIKLDGISPVGTIALGKDSYFSQRKTAPYKFSIYENTNYLFHADTNTYSSQKYFKWQDISDVKNFRVKNSGITNFQIRSNFNTAYSTIIIKNNFLESPSLDPANDFIQFKDPWLIDYKDPNHGYHRRNRGMAEAVFASRLSPFCPDNSTIYDGNKYRGIFLNQDPSQTLTYYSVKAPQSVNFGGSIGVRNVYLQNWSANPSNNASLENANGNETGVVFKSTAATTISANLKISQVSNNSSAFSNNSQRKFVRTKETPTGWLHQVYESMGHVWLEHSSNSGSTWFLGNNGQPLDNGAGKCPSIDWFYDGAAHCIVIVFQQKINDNSYDIRYSVFTNNNGTYISNLLGSATSISLCTVNESYSTNANPTITVGGMVGGVGRFAFTWERKNGTPGIYYIYGEMAAHGLYSPGNPGYPQATTYPSNPTFLTGTTANSANASVNINKMYSNFTTFNIVYQQDASTVYWKYINCTRNGGSWNCSNTYTANLSSSTGQQNYKPSMVQMPDGEIKVCWIRNLYGTINTVYWNSANPSVFTYSGYKVNSVSLNIRDDNTNTYYAYAQNTTGSVWQNFARSGSSITTLNTTGQNIQLSNGPSSAGMYASSYYSSALPY